MASSLFGRGTENTRSVEEVKADQDAARKADVKREKVQIRRSRRAI